MAIGQTPFIPNVIKKIITRIIAALIAPCAGLLRLVGVLQLLYSKPATPNHIFSWVRISFEAWFEFDPKTAMSKWRAHILKWWLRSGVGRILLAVDDATNASLCVTFSLSCTEGCGDADTESKDSPTRSPNLIVHSGFVYWIRQDESIFCVFLWQLPILIVHNKL